MSLPDAAGTTLSTGDGRQFVVGALVKSGGAGSVYRLRDDAAQVAKLYHPGADLRMYERRIAAMLELQPQLPELAQDGNRYVQLAWPDAPLHDARGRFIGYLMPVVDIDATDELEFVLQESQARRHHLPTGLGAKVTLAANLCAVIAALHRERHYIVDLKPVNLRFYRQSLYMAMLDCDGFSIQGHGERFEAPQYTPEYLAPEFHLRELTAAGEAQQDRFALAVVVFQLLNFGIHPFTGRPQSGHVPTDIPSRIAGRWYAYGLKANASLLPTISSGHAAMPVELRTLFDRAFDTSGSTRPSADEWSDLLRGYAQRAAGKLVACERNAAHQHFTGLECAACHRGRALADARAAAARRPPRPRAIPKSALTLGWPTTPPRAPGSTAAASSGALPPHVQARLKQAWANQAPAVMSPGTAPPLAAALPRRPANMPATPSRQDPWLTGLFVLVLLAFLLGLVGLITDAGRVPPAATPTTQAPQGAAQPKAADILSELRMPRPFGDDLGEQAREIDVLSSALIEGNDGGVLRGLGALHARARDRQEGWRRQRERARAAGVDLARVPGDDAVAEAGVASRQHGWIALDQGDRPRATEHFAEAIWADDQDADAWLGYGLSTSSAKEAIGAVTVALLMYPDVATAHERHDEYVPLAARDDQRRQQELENVFIAAASFVERQRQRLPPDMVRLSEPFSWDAQ